MSENRDIDPFRPKFQVRLDHFNLHPTESDLQECYEKESQFDYSGFAQPAVENSDDDDDDATQPLRHNIFHTHRLSYL